MATAGFRASAQPPDGAEYDDAVTQADARAREGFKRLNLFENLT
jgi:hypothetical protein